MSVNFALIAVSVLVILVRIVMIGVGIYLLYLVIRALRAYIRSKEVRAEKKEICRTLGEQRRAERTRCKMTQEFVAETLGVSRQAVSKWENGTADPSTANLLALAKLYGVSAEDLLRSAAGKEDEA